MEEHGKQICVFVAHRDSSLKITVIYLNFAHNNSVMWLLLWNKWQKKKVRQFACDHQMEMSRQWVSNNWSRLEKHKLTYETIIAEGVRDETGQMICFLRWSTSDFYIKEHTVAFVRMFGSRCIFVLSYASVA